MTKFMMRKSNKNFNFRNLKEIASDLIRKQRLEQKYQNKTIRKTLKNDIYNNKSVFCYF